MHKMEKTEGGEGLGRRKGEKKRKFESNDCPVIPGGGGGDDRQARPPFGQKTIDDIKSAKPAPVRFLVAAILFCACQVPK